MNDVRKIMKIDITINEGNIGRVWASQEIERKVWVFIIRYFYILSDHEL